MRRVLHGIVLLAGVLGGCVGEIGDPPGLAGGLGPEVALDSGRVTLHRLNRVEYNNTVRDLLGTTQTPANDFPTDDYGYGYDNIADVLSISPLQLELYERAAEALADEVLAAPSAAELIKHEGEDLTSPVGAATAEAYNLYSSGELGVTISFPTTGKYRVAARVWGQQAGPDPVEMSMSVGGALLGQYDITATSAAPVVIESVTDVTAGNKVVAVEFLNDFYDPATSADRNLLVDWIEVEGPIDAQVENPLRDRIVTCDPAVGGDPCVRTILSDFGKRAWRRPLTTAEVDGLMAFVALAESQGDDVDTGLALAVRATLVSPHFIFRVELDPDLSSPESHPLDGFELASRLSYFLWSSMPDDELFAAAAEGLLADEAELESQVERMLDDPRAEALIENFGGQWLYTRGLADHQPDYAAFPDYDDELKAAMKEETRLFLREFLHGDVGVDALLTSDFTFLNDRLAQHYGLEAPGGSDLVKVTLAGDQRGGLLTQASLLTVTSYPTRTSPVKRGKWILSQLLCSEPPPPPPGVEGLETQEVPTGSIRERMEQHRTDPVCIACHATMDPLGFGLEHFDGVGAFRTADGEFPIDATGALPTGESFDGAREMAAVIGGDSRFGRCLAKHLYTYGLGRGPETSDDPFLDAIAADFADRGLRLRELVKLIVLSEPFRMRRAELEGN